MGGRERARLDDGGLTEHLPVVFPLDSCLRTKHLAGEVATLPAPMTNPIVYGADYSTYVRAVRMALTIKRQPYELTSVDVLAGEGQKPEHLARHPFGKVPVLEHDGFSIYETPAIMDYIERAFDGPSILPSSAQEAGRARQIESVIYIYGYTPLVGQLFIGGVVQPKLGNARDEAAVAQGIEAGKPVLAALDALVGQPFAVGGAVSVADFALVPILEYFMLCPEASEMMKAAPRLAAWWDAFKSQSVVAETRPALIS